MTEFRGVPTNQWLVPETSPEIQTRIAKANVVAQLARRVPMRTKQLTRKRSAPRYPQFLSGGGGQTGPYPVERKHGDKITMTAEKMGDRVFYDEDDLSDLDADLISADITEILYKANIMRSRAMIATDIGKAGYPSLTEDSDLGVGAPYESLLNVLLYGRDGRQGTYDPPLGSAGHVLVPGDAPSATNGLSGFSTDVKNLSLVTGSGSNKDSALRNENYAYELLSSMKRPVDEGPYMEFQNMAYIFDYRFVNLFENTTDDNGQPLLGTVQGGAFQTLLNRPVFWQNGMSWAASGWAERDYYLVSGLGTGSDSNAPRQSLAVDGEYAIQWANTNVTPNDDLSVWKMIGGSWSHLSLIADNTAVPSGSIYSKVSLPDGTGNPSGVLTNGNGTGAVSIGGLVVVSGLRKFFEWRGGAAGGGVESQRSNVGLGGYGNWKELFVGDRMRTEFMLSTPRAHDDFDTVALKARERQGCVVRQPSAFCMTAVEFT